MISNATLRALLGESEDALARNKQNLDTFDGMFQSTNQIGDLIETAFAIMW